MPHRMTHARSRDAGCAGNDGNFAFVRVMDAGSLTSVRSHLHGVQGDSVRSEVVAVADYDNDGKLDLLMTNNGATEYSQPQPNELHKGNGDGTFSLVTGTSISSLSTDSLTAAWGDLNNDGV